MSVLHKALCRKPIFSFSDALKENYDLRFFWRAHVINCITLLKAKLKHFFFAVLMKSSIYYSAYFIMAFLCVITHVAHYTDRDCRTLERQKRKQV